MRTRNILAILLFPLVFALLAPEAASQRRDYLSEEEIEIIRQSQDIDVRIEVLVRMIDRRFAALEVPVQGWTPPAKAIADWGQAPTGTRLELLSDVKKLLQKAIDDIDNLSANPSAARIREKGDRQARKDPQRLPNAVRSLAAAARRYIGPLKAEIEKTDNGREKGLMMDAIDMCEQIIEAAGKVPPEPKKS
jgi:hypothetical protein